MVDILVTGGAGFIGSNFIRYMLNKYEDYRIINLDKLTYAGNLDNLCGVCEDRHLFVKGDICDRQLVNELFEAYHFKYVVNFAAESHVDRSIEDPEAFLRTNILGTQVLLDACKKYWLSARHSSAISDTEKQIDNKFLQVSTDEVYGSLGADGYFTENTPLAPNSPYSASKAAADMIVRSYKETFGLNINITRCSNNYGSYQFPEKLIPLMISNAWEDKELPVYGDGMNIRDWLYVEDHCRAIDAVLHEGKSGEVYNIGGHNEKANIEIVRLILKELGKPETLIKYVKDRPGHDRRYAIDASKLKAELGWEPAIMFDEGIVKTIKWYMENSDWFAGVLSGAYMEYYERMYKER